MNARPRRSTTTCSPAARRVVRASSSSATVARSSSPERFRNERSPCCTTSMENGGGSNSLIHPEAYDTGRGLESRAVTPRNVRTATFDFLRARGMTTIFGNPGSTELPMLQQFPSDFTYVLGLQEATVVGMADGYAQASGRPTFVNLHTAPGVGNAMGAIFNAQANKAPLVITAGNQTRSLMTLQANLTNRDATRMPHPLVKWSYEPPRAEDVPHAIARATHLATLPPRGPVFVSIPMDDWAAEVDEPAAEHQLSRVVSGAAAAPVGELAQALAGAANPVMVAGPDVDAGGAWGAAVALAEQAALPVWATPAPGGGRGAARHRPRAAAATGCTVRGRADRSDERVYGDARARRGLPRWRDRRARGAERHAGAAQPAAPVQAGLVLLRRGWRPRLRA